ncbi:TetR/AcrR family transcriptional regulator [uncultured Phenylobacterium sp.]|uniref:TetR/AcrR family transcriptional regulator n=1 Tax=uncultured Phenylobacterium sp. TaxID=349273 RepID=UPI0025D6F2F6|nr:TetR/AcrR family transcriptional regulator [uncultured Phenylobacterium sp.]
MPRYHHGDLRAALVQEASAAVDTGGPEAVSLRDLAKQLGVSTAAPYRHFADRRALLSEVAERGFVQLTHDYQRVAAEHADPVVAQRETARLYLGLAFRKPGLFRLMFASDLLGPGATPGLLKAAGDSWSALSASVRRMDPEADPATITRRTITGWSTLHGFIALVQGGRLKGFMTEPLTEAELVEAILDKTLSGD